VFEDIDKEMNMKLKKEKNKGIRALPDRIEDKSARGKNMDWTFKSNTTRANNAVSLFNKVPISVNEGENKLNYDPIDAIVPRPDL